MSTSTSDDYADEAESAERAEAWPQAAALWRRAAEMCDDVDQRRRFVEAASRCDDEVASLAAIAVLAKRHLGIPTLDVRRSDRLDFHEVGVSALRSALCAAYKAGGDAAK
jgi:hypothetical protein